MTALSGHDASVLALLAQSKSLSEGDKQKLLSSLEGRALSVGKALAGMDPAPTPADAAAAEGYQRWAAGQLSRRSPR